MNVRNAEASTPSARRRAASPTWLIATVAGVFGLFFAYAVWNAVAFTVQNATGTLGLSAWGWFVLLFAVAFPILVFAVSFAIGWRREWWQFALVLLTGLALTATFWLNVVAYATSSLSLFGG